MRKELLQSGPARLHTSNSCVLASPARLGCPIIRFVGQGERRTEMRDRYNAFIERHEVAWELAFAFLAVIYVAIGFALDDPNISIDPQFAVIEPVLTIVFALEFGTRIAASYDRRNYLRRHWIDLVALIPVARGLRVARLLRLLRLVRAFAGLYRVVDHFERLARHRGSRPSLWPGRR
jgi:hypothetical protein